MTTNKDTKTNLTTMSRRNVLKFSFAALATGLLSNSLLRPALAQAAEPTKPLIVYYSRTGNTKAVANQIQSLVGGDLFELRTTHSYPEDYRATTDQAKQELSSNFRPQLVNQVTNLDSYNLVFVGYPIWWSTFPMAFFTFFESANFAGKTIVPFCTHEGSGLSRSPADIAKLAPKAKLLQGLAIRGKRASSAQAEVESWLKSLKLMS